MPTYQELLQQRDERRERNKDIKRVNNGDLYAGSPMYYYCRDCGEEMKLPEGHWEAAPTYCGGCKRLLKASIELEAALRAQGNSG